VDALPGSVMYGVEMFADDAVRPFYGKSAQRYRDTMSYPGGVLLPMQVRVVWRKSDNSFWKEGLIRYNDDVEGDYTIDVAGRIPDEFVADLKAERGAIRLKFRLKPDGVLFGWDIETYGALRYLKPGGDFVDTLY
jgi:hypothetical protein